MAMVAPRKKATPAKKAAAQLAKNQPGRLRKAPPEQRRYAVLVRKPSGQEYIERVVATSAVEAKAKVEATLRAATLPEVTDVLDEGASR